MSRFLCRSALVFVALALARSSVAAETPQQAFARSWVGKTVTVKQVLYTLVYNERGVLRNVHTGRRQGITVVTPSEGVFFQFDARQGREDVVERQPHKIFEAVNVEYRPDELDLRAARKIEPVVLERLDPGVELVVSGVRIDRDTVIVTFSQAGAPDAGGDSATSLRVKWSVQLSKTFSERDAVETLIRQFVDFKQTP